VEDGSVAGERSIMFRAVVDRRAGDGTRMEWKMVWGIEVGWLVGRNAGGGREAGWSMGRLQGLKKAGWCVAGSMRWMNERDGGYGCYRMG